LGFGGGILNYSSLITRASGSKFEGLHSSFNFFASHLLAEACGLLLGPIIVAISYPIKGYRGLFWAFTLLTVLSWATTWASLIAETFDPRYEAPADLNDIPTNVNKPEKN
jgi:MFS family permease